MVGRDALKQLLAAADPGVEAVSGTLATLTERGVRNNSIRGTCSLIVLVRPDLASHMYRMCALGGEGG